jgi:hypothetical protein
MCKINERERKNEEDADNCTNKIFSDGQKIKSRFIEMKQKHSTLFDFLSLFERNMVHKPTDF